MSKKFNTKRLLSRLQISINFFMVFAMLLWTIGPLALNPNIFIRPAHAASLTSATLSENQSILGGSFVIDFLVLQFGENLPAPTSNLCNLQGVGSFDCYEGFNDALGDFTADAGISLATAGGTDRQILTVTNGSVFDTIFGSSGHTDDQAILIAQGTGGPGNVNPDDTFGFTATNFANATAGTGYQIGCSGNCAPSGGSQGQQNQAPQLSGGSPQDRGVDVPTWPVIYVEFDVGLDASTVNTSTVSLFECTGTNDALSCPGTTGSNLCSSVSLVNSTIVNCEIANALDANKTYQFSVSTGVQSTQGTALASTVNRIFRTSSYAFGTVDTPAGVAWTSPAPGEQNVGINANLAVEFFSDMATSGSGSVTSTDNVQLKLAQYGEPTGSNICANGGCTLTYDSSSNTLKIDPTSNLQSSTEYALVIMSTAQSADGNSMPMDMIIIFTTGTSSDSTAPTVNGTYPIMFTDAQSLSVGSQIDTNSSGIELFFTKPLDKTTINSSNVKFFKDKVGANDFLQDSSEPDINVALSYESQENAIFVGLINTLSTSSTYCVSLGSGITDTNGNAITPSVYCVSTQETATQDSFGPVLIFADCNNNKCWLEFDEPLDQTEAERSTNYRLETYAEGQQSGSEINLNTSNVNFTYESSFRAVAIEGLTLTPNNVFKFTLNNIEDRSGNTIVGNTTFQGIVLDSSITGEYLGSQAGSQDWESNTDFGTYWENPESCAPWSMTAGETTNFECEFPMPMAVDDTNFTVKLTMPSGFNFSGVKAPSSSFINDDMNDWAPGKITFQTSGVPDDDESALSKGGAANDGITTDPTGITLHLTHNGDAADAGEQIRFEIANIVNTLTPGEKTITAVVQDTDGIKRGETIAFSPFTIGAAGNLSISGTICKGATSGGSCTENDTPISGAKVFLESWGSFESGGSMGGLKETTTDANGNYTFNNLSGGQFGLGIMMDPSVFSDVSGGSDFRDIYLNSNITGEDFKFVDLSSSGKTLSVTIDGPASTDLDVFCFAPSDFESSTPILKTVTTDSNGDAATSMKLQANTTYECNLGPAIPHDTQFDSKNFAPTFNFMPPSPQIVNVGNNDVNITFNLQSANYQIVGKVQDSNGTGIANVWVDAFPAYQKGIDSTGEFVDMQGTFTQTAKDGTFTLNAISGVYQVSACSSGMPCSNPVEVTVKDNNAQNSDGNSTADVYSNGTLLTGTGLILKMPKTSTTISGKVKDENGNGIKYGFVSAEKVTPGDSCSNFTPTGGHADSPTDDSGNYTLYVGNGTWKVSAHAPAYGFVGCSIITMNGTSKTGQNISASAADYGTINGTVTKDGSAVSGAHVGCFGSNGGNQAVTQSDGTFSMKLKVGSYTCDGFIEGVGPLTPADNVTITAEQTTTTNFTLGNPGTIIIDLGSTITDAFCDARGSNKKGVGTGQNNNGIYTIKVPAGTYNVKCSNPKYGEVYSSSSVAVTAGQTTALTGTPPTLYTVTGQVTDGTNNLEGVTVSFTDNTNGRMATAQSNGVSSGNNVSISLPAGTYNVIASKSGYVDSSSVQSLTVSAATSFATRSLSLASATVALTAQSDGANYGGKAKVVATDTNGRVVTANVDPAITSGANAILNLTDGTWTVKAFTDKGKTVSEGTTIVVTDDTPDNSTLTLALDSDISGFTYKEPEKLPLVPKNGGNFKFTEFNEDFSVEIPKNILSSSDSNSGTLSIELDPSHAISTPGKTFVGSEAIDITPTDNSGKELSTFESEKQGVTITIPYQDADLTSANVSEENLMVASWNEASQEWETLPTTIDSTNNLLVAQATHFSTFGIVGMAAAAATTTTSSGGISSDITAPSTPTNVSISRDSNGKPVITWTDPSDSDLKEIQILRGEGNIPVSGTTYATVAKGVQTYTDTAALSGTSYSYKLRASDTSNNLSDVSAGVTITALEPSTSDGETSGGGGGGSSAMPTTTREEETIEAPASTEEVTTEEETAPETTTDSRADEISIIKSEASIVSTGIEKIREALKAVVDFVKESTAMDLISKIAATVTDALKGFIAYGTETTISLGEGERAGVINSFRAAFGREPSTVADWEDVIKIANGRWPSHTNDEAEAAAKERFQDIYLREANMDNVHDNAAVTIMAYGLRPHPRNLDSERAAITIFKNIFGSNPASATDWDTVRAIGYSGATR